MLTRPQVLEKLEVLRVEQKHLLDALKHNELRQATLVEVLGGEESPKPAPPKPTQRVEAPLPPSPKLPKASSPKGQAPTTYELLKQIFQTTGRDAMNQAELTEEAAKLGHPLKKTTLHNTLLRYTGKGFERTGRGMWRMVPPQPSSAYPGVGSLNFEGGAES